MGCIPLLESVFDYRFVAVVIFWLAFGSLTLLVLLRKSWHLKRCLLKLEYIVIVSLNHCTYMYFYRLVMISLAMVIVPFLPATNLLLHVGFVVAERVLYLPSAGWCLLFALGLTLMIKRYKTVSDSWMW